MKLCTAVQEGCGYKVTLSAHRYFAPSVKYFTVCITYQPPLVCDNSTSFIWSMIMCVCGEQNNTAHCTQVSHSTWNQNCSIITQLTASRNVVINWTHHYTLYHRDSICLVVPIETVCCAELYTGMLCLVDTVCPQTEPIKNNCISNTRYKKMITLCMQKETRHIEVWRYSQLLYTIIIWNMCKPTVKKYFATILREITNSCIYRCILTYLPTPWSRVLLEKLTGFQLVKKFPTNQ